MDDGVGESSSTVGEKPVIVRVKRKVGQSPLDAFCKFQVEKKLSL